MLDIYIRPLQIADSKISYRWRNDPDIWKYTGSKPDRYIDEKTETEWLKSKVSLDNEKRFAICLRHNDEYIGNVQLTDIKEQDSAEFHIFIGEKKYWGNGIGTRATSLIINYGFNELNLKKIYLNVNVNNISAVNAYENVGFKRDILPIDRYIIQGKRNNQITMSIQREDYYRLLEEGKKNG